MKSFTPGKPLNRYYKVSLTCSEILEKVFNKIDDTQKLTWTTKKSSEYIESILMQFPCPPIYLMEDSLGSFSVIDGLQRLLTIREFMADNIELCDLSLIPELNSKKVSGIGERWKRILEVHQLTLIIYHQNYGLVEAIRKKLNS